MLGQLLIAGIATGSAYALVSIGIVIVFRASGVVNFGQGAYAMLGAFFALTLARTQLFSPWLTIVLALLGMGMVGWLTERIVLRPLREAPLVSLMMATLAMLIFLRGVATGIWGTSNFVLPPLFPNFVMEVGGLFVSSVYLWTVVLAAVAVVGLLLFFRFTRWGLAMRACADNRQASLALGVPLNRVVALSWFMGSVIAGIGGILLGSLSLVNVNLDQVGLIAFPVAVLGGLGSVPGAFLAAFLLGIIESLAGGYLVPVLEKALSSVFGYVSLGAIGHPLAFAILLLMLLVRPQGLLGQKEVHRL